MDPESEIYRDIVCVKYRTAYPTLRPLPLEPTNQTPSDRALIEPIRNKIYLRAGEIMAQYGFNYNKMRVDILGRQLPNEPDTAVPTVLIFAPWRGDDAQNACKQAVHDIVKLIDNLLEDIGAREAIHVDVELMAKELTRTKYLGRVLDEPDLHAAWDDIKALVCSRLESYQTTRDSWNTIALFRLGYLTDETTNPITIYISVDSTSDETKWEDIVSDIKENLDDWGFLEVLIEHNTITTSTYPLLPPEGAHDDINRRSCRNQLIIHDDYSIPVNLSDSIGMSRNTESPNGRCSQGGTLGCYIELKTESSPVWAKYGLTSRYSVQPSFSGCTSIPSGSPQGESELRESDQAGDQAAWSSRYEASTLVESPPRTKHNYNLWSLNNNIQFLKSVRENPSSLKMYETQRAANLAFFEEETHLFGHISRSSEFRLTPESSDCRLDWALIKPFGARQGSNRLPNGEVWDAKYHFELWKPSYKTYGGFLQDQCSSICYEADEKDSLPLARNGWKVGATTGPTSGHFHDFRPSIRMTHEKHMNFSSSELYVFQDLLGYHKPVPTSGDSGAVVFDCNGGILGLLVGTQRPFCVKQEYSFVTPIEHIFEDIKSSSQGEITEIRVARD
ncbi:hypothetical protein FSARC_11461 [Fusarium sarcochroum]|uniref:Serine protease n=1 Tax=Fusarium sarcochroum TaxID=1208366 RepID=A0A8H4TFG4_9HYPO|nr:hypothetical protein FSARC_11461 [Fusarium sarcochroum]